MSSEDVLVIPTEESHLFFEGGWYSKAEIATYLCDLCEGKISEAHTSDDDSAMNNAKNIFELLKLAEKNLPGPPMPDEDASGWTSFAKHNPYRRS